MRVNVTNFFQSGDKNLCCGCGACEQICPENAIHMEQDKEGFFYPVVDEERCTGCGMCAKVCPMKDGGYYNKSALKNPNVYAAYHKDEQVLNNSTSGGVFTAVVQAFCDKDYVIFGASFDKDMVVKHTFVTDSKNISKFRGSKYVQSEVGSSFDSARKFLKEGKRVLFSGTPCQIAGLKGFLRKDYESLLTVDVVCHGVPSPSIFEKYKQYLTRKYKKDIVGINFRDKSKRRWIKPYGTVKFEDGQILRTVHADNACI
ncbi:MAG: 4Fe-4S binding protein, partial [Candidatus Odinarchaeia archaeon]